MNEVEGYQYAFRARLPQEGKPPRQLFGRVVMLPEPYDIEDPGKPYPAGEAPRQRGADHDAGHDARYAREPIRVGDEGSLQRPFRSFRFGDG